MDLVGAWWAIRFVLSEDICCDHLFLYFVFVYKKLHNAVSHAKIVSLHAQQDGWKSHENQHRLLWFKPNWQNIDEVLQGLSCSWFCHSDAGRHGIVWSLPYFDCRYCSFYCQSLHSNTSWTGNYPSAVDFEKSDTNIERNPTNGLNFERPNPLRLRHAGLGPCHFQSIQQGPSFYQDLRQSSHDVSTRHSPAHGLPPVHGNADGDSNQHSECMRRIVRCLVQRKNRLRLAIVHDLEHPWHSLVLVGDHSFLWRVWKHDDIFEEDVHLYQFGERGWPC